MSLTTLLFLREFFCLRSDGSLSGCFLGFFGSLSTFSTFVVELLNTLQNRLFLQFVGLMVFSLVIGLLAAAAGYQLGLSRG